LSVGDGNISVTLTAGDLAIEDTVQAQDSSNDGIRAGLIDLIVGGGGVAGNMTVGADGPAQITSLNDVDDDVAGGLGSDPTDQVAIRLQLNDIDSTQTITIGDGSGTDDVVILADGGDILIDAGGDAIPSTSSESREVIVDSDARIEAYNAAGDAENGDITISGQATIDGDLADHVVARTWREIKLKGSSSDIVIGGANRTIGDLAGYTAPAGNLTLEPGGANDVIINDGAFITVTEDGGATDGTLIIINANDIVMYADTSNSSITVDGSLLIGQRLDGSAGPITGDVTLYDITFDANDDGLPVQGAEATLLIANVSGTISLNGSIESGIGGTPVDEGAVSIDHDDALVIEDTAAVTIEGSFSQTGSGTVSVAGDITTTGDDISFEGAVTLADGVALSTGPGGGGITFGGTLDGTTDFIEGLTLTAGTGSIDFDDAVGSIIDLGDLLIVSAANVTADAGFNANTLTQQGGTGTGTTQFDGTVMLEASGGLNLGSLSALNDVEINGDIDTLTAANGGTVTINLDGVLDIEADADMTLGGAFSQTGGGTVETAGDITTSGEDITFASAVTLTDDHAVAFSTGSGGGTITFGSTLDGSTDFNEDLTLTAGAGNIDFDAAVGSITDPGDVVIVSAANVTADAAFNANSLTQQGGTDTSTFDGAMTFEGADGLNLGSVSALNDVAVNNDIDTLAAANGGTVAINVDGVLDIAPDADMTLDGAFSQTGGGTVETAGDVTTSGEDITFASAVVLTDAHTVAFSTGGGAGTITFGGELDGSTDFAEDLTLTAGTGNIDFDQSVGSANDLGDVLIASAADVTADADVNANSLTQQNGSGTTRFDDMVTLEGLGGLSLGTLSALNDVTINGGVDTLTAANGGTVTINLGGVLDVAPDADMTLDGAFSQTGGGTVETAGDITTSNDAIDFASMVTLTDAHTVAFSTGGGAGTITFQSELDGSTEFAEDLNLTAGTGNIDFDQSVGGATDLGDVTIVSATDVTVDEDFNANTLTQQNGAGTTLFDGPVVLQAAGGLDIGSATAVNNVTLNDTIDTLTALNDGTVTINLGGVLDIAPDADMTLDGAFSQAGGGTVETAGDITTSGDAIDFASAVTLTDDHAVAFSTGEGVGGAITFGGTLDGSTNFAEDLTLTAGTGNIDFDDAVGSITDLGDVVIASAANVTADAGFNANTLTQQNGTGTGTTRFDGAVLLNGAGGMNLGSVGAVNNVTFNDTVATLTGGTVAINLDGVLDIAPDADMTLDGAFSQTGSGTTETAGDITTTADDIDFASAVTLTDAHGVAFSTGAGVGGTITFGGTLDGETDFDEDLTLTAGAGSIDFDAAAGSTAALGDVTIVSATDVTVSGGFQANTLAQQTGTGTFRLDGAMALEGAAGLHLGSVSALNDVEINGDIDTLAAGNGGTATINLGGVLDIAPDADMTLDGAFSQTGGGTVQTAGDITTSGEDITFASAVTLTDGHATALSTGGGGGTITFSSTLDGSTDFAEDLTLTAGAGNIDFDQTVGDGVDLGDVIIVSAANVTVDESFNVRTLTQQNGTGTVQFDGAVLLSAAGGMHLGSSGALNDVTVNNTVTTLSGGTVTINLGGVLNIAPGADMVLDGAFSQTGSGTVETAGDITTSGDDIGFASAVTLTDGHTVALGTGGGAGTITFGGTLDGASDFAESLTLTAGTGNIDFDGAVGSAVDPGDVIIVSAANTTADAGFNADTFFQQGGTGTTRFDGATVFETALTVENAADFTTGSTLTVDGDIDITTTQGSAEVNLNGPLATTSGGTVTIDNRGTLTVSSGATLTLDGAFLQEGEGDVDLSDDIITTDDAITFQGEGTVILGASVSLDTDTAGPGDGANITFGVENQEGSKIDGAAAEAQDLDLTAGNGDITFWDDIGAITRLGNITFHSATNISAHGSIRAESIAQEVSDPSDPATYLAYGTTTFAGGVNTSGIDGIDLDGKIFIFSNQITTTNGGPLVVTSHDATNGQIHLVSEVIDVNGATTFDGSGQLIMSGDLNTDGTTITFPDALMLLGDDMSVSTGANSAGDIIFYQPVGGDFKLTLTTGLGDVLFQSAVGEGAGGADAPLSGLNIPLADEVEFQGSVAVDDEGIYIAQANEVTFSGAVESGNGGDILINNSGLLTVADGADMDLDGEFDQDGSGDVSLAGDISTTGDDISFRGAVSLDGDAAISTGSGAGSITFESTLDGANNLNLTAGTGSVSFEDAVGGDQNLGDLTIASASGGVTFSSTADAGSVSIDDGGRVKISDALNAALGFVTAGASFNNPDGPITTTSGDIVLDYTANIEIDTALTSDSGDIDIDAGGTLNLDAALSTTTGTVTVDSGGNMTISSSGDITTTQGSVTFGADQSGDINTSGDVTTTGGDVEYNSAVTLARNLVISTGATAPGAIVFNGALDGSAEGAQDIDLTAGSGSVSFNQAVGGTIALGNLTIVSANGGVTAGSTIDADTVAIDNGGAVDLNGDVRAASGFSSEGTTFDNSGGVIETDNAAIAIDHSDTVTIGADLSSQGGSITIASGGALSISDGALVDAGSGLIALEAEENVTLGGLATTDNTPFAVQITSTGGSVVDGGDTHLDVSAPDGTLTITAAGGIGDGDNLELQVATLKASSTVAGDIGVEEADDIVLDGVGTTASDIYVESGGDITATDVKAGSNGDVTLISDSGGDITVDSIDAGKGTVSLGTTGDINGGTISAGAVDLTANTVGTESAMTIDADSLSAVLSGQDASGVSAVLVKGASLDSASEDNISAPGTFIIQGLVTFLAAELADVEGALYTLATVSTEQATLEMLLREAAEAQFFMTPPLEIYIDMEEEEEFEPEEEGEEGEIFFESLMRPSIRRPGLDNGFHIPSTLLKEYRLKVLPGLSYFQGWRLKRQPNLEGLNVAAK